jgi:hypothetical protein
MRLADWTNAALKSFRKRRRPPRAQEWSNRKSICGRQIFERKSVQSSETRIDKQGRI